MHPSSSPFFCRFFLISNFTPVASFLVFYFCHLTFPFLMFIKDVFVVVFKIHEGNNCLSELRSTERPEMW
jgi:hypothetical protein